MGAGASVEGAGPGGADNNSRYFCHMCRRPFSGSQATDVRCPYCSETFVEQVEEFRYPVGGGGGMVRVIHRGAGHSRGADTDDMELSEDQRRRLLNAAALLQLLEAHLREELQALERAVRDSEGAKDPGALTDLEKHTFLKSACVSKDDMCSQPSCPICGEDFSLHEEALQLQCSHLFHEGCVVPWLEMKHNCPICRCDISEALPTLAEIEKLTETEIKQRTRWHDCEPEATANREQLAKHLHEILLHHRELYIDAKEPADKLQSLQVEEGAPGPAPMRPGHTYTISSRGEISQASAVSSDSFTPAAALAPERGDNVLNNLAATGIADRSGTGSGDYTEP